MKAAPLIFLGLLLAHDATAAEQPSAKDAEAQREFALAQPKINEIDAALEGEMKRLLYKLPQPPSDVLKKFIHTANATHVEIGDVSAPLHLRLIERERREAVASIEFSKQAARPCDEAPLSPDQMLDARARQRVLDAVQCHRDRLDEFQIGQHQMLKGEATSLLLLKLPPVTQEEMLERIRLRTLQQDGSLESDFAQRRKGLSATEDFVKFLGEHAAKIRVTNNQLLFEDPADMEAAMKLMKQVEQLNQ